MFEISSWTIPYSARSGWIKIVAKLNIEHVEIGLFKFHLKCIKYTKSDRKVVLAQWVLIGVLKKVAAFDVLVDLHIGPLE
jgi:hypothetical protein